ncbi:DUF3276 family protein [Blattabacterium cuenoti]|uniref:DUF3276 family protein n=1 Tax=Blattabacterium cuenoti TaxID=1653831 RepID=UPI00163D29A8|nr:DUF3276 family protein [Blattabacterium cuenoti]
MDEKENIKERNDRNEICSKTLKTGSRTYFFDARETRAGDYYLTITESKKNYSETGEISYKKHKIYLYKEDFSKFQSILDDMIKFIINEKGSEVISERHQKDFKTHYQTHHHNQNQDVKEVKIKKTSGVKNFTNINFEDI